MNLLDRAIAAISPAAGLSRIRNRQAIQTLANFNAATRTSRGSGFRPVSSDADAASVDRQRLSWVTRDMIRNNPFATKAQAVIAGATVGDGIVYKIRPEAGRRRAPAAALSDVLKRHLETRDIDAEGRANLYGIQRLAVMAMVQDGEVLLRRWRRRPAPGRGLPLQIQILEADYLDASRDGQLPNGNLVKEGIEFDQEGRRVAYYLYDEHPGASGFRLSLGLTSKRIPASEIIHVFRQDRPGQHRGVSWFHSVALQLQDIQDYQEAQVLRQKIAACFVAFRTRGDGEARSEADPMQIATLTPGRIQMLEPGEDIRFSAPPAVTNYSEFVREVLASVAAGLGITYAALTGDLSQTNFSSGRLGRIEMDANVSAWQWLLLVPQMLDPVAAWIVESVTEAAMQPAPFRLEWVPPARIVVDPAREMKAFADMVAAGFTSRQEIIRRLGYDPEDVMREHAEDKQAADAAGVTFTTQATAPEPDPAKEER